jgi:hypothetical protein
MGRVLVPSKPKCKFSKPDGSTCGGNCLKNSDYCYFHDPAQAAHRQQARRKGGRARSKPMAVLSISAPDEPVESIEDVVRLLGQTINEVRKGQLDAKIANAVGYLASVMLRALEGAEFEERLARLEEVAGQQTRRAL